MIQRVLIISFLVGLSLVDDCFVTINSSPNIIRDTEEWLEIPIGIGDRLTISMSISTYIINDTYIEIDYLELLPEKLFYNYSSLESSLAYHITPPQSFYEPLLIGSGVYKDDITTYPVFLPVRLCNGNIPTLSDTEPYELIDSRYWITRSINNDTMAIDQLMYTGTIDDTAYNLPVPVVSTVSIYKNNTPYRYLVDSLEIEDFQLGTLRCGWHSPSPDDTGKWQFTTEGLVSPINNYGEAVIYTHIFEDHTISEIAITYEVEFDQQNSTFNGGIRFGLLDQYNSSYSEQDTSIGTHVVYLYPGSYSFYLGLYHYNYVVETANQRVVIKSIVFNGISKPSLGEVSENSVEIFPNGQPSMPWEFNGAWLPIPTINDGLNSLLLKAPIYEAGRYAQISFNVDCVDGDLSIKLVANSTSSTILIDGISMASPSTSDLLSYNFQVTLGQHSITIITKIWPWMTYDNYTTYCGIEEIVFPTTVNSVFNHQTKDLFTYSIISGTIGSNYTEIADPTALEWQWTLGSEFITGHDRSIFGTLISGTGQQDMKITIPIAEPTGYTDMWVYGQGYRQVAQMPYTSIGFELGCVNNATLDYNGVIILRVYTSWGGTLDQYTYNGNYYSLVMSSITNESNYLVSKDAYSDIYASPIPDTGTIIFNMKWENVQEYSAVYFNEIYLPVKTTPIDVNILPINEVVTFPINVEFTFNSIFKIFYTLDGSDPKTSLTSYEYTNSFSLDYKRIVRYAIKLISTLEWLENNLIKIYTDKPIVYYDLFYHVNTIGIDKYVQFYTYPFFIPVSRVNEVDSEIVYTVCMFNYIKLNSGINNFLMCLPSEKSILSVIDYFPFDVEPTTKSYELNNSLLNLIPITINNEQSVFNGQFLSLFSILVEIVSFLPTIIPSIPSGTYSQTIQVQFRTNIEQYQLELDNEILNEDSMVDISISTILEFKLTDLSSNAISYHSIAYYIVNLNNYIEFCSHRITNYSKNMHYASINFGASEYLQHNSIDRSVINYVELNNISSNTTYELYKEYINNGNIMALFADEELTMPFPLTFSIIVGPNDYILLPDQYASIYRDGIKFNDYEQENLVCRITSYIGSNTELDVVSDMCIRLCINVSSLSPEEAILQVWTNIPKDNFLASSNTAVVLSVDGINFAQTIILTSNTLYIKGIKPAVFNYGDNVFNTLISVVSCEVTNGSIF